MLFPCLCYTRPIFDSRRYLLVGVGHEEAGKVAGTFSWLNYSASRKNILLDPEFSHHSVAAAVFLSQLLFDIVQHSYFAMATHHNEPDSSPDESKPVSQKSSKLDEAVPDITNAPINSETTYGFNVPLEPEERSRYKSPILCSSSMTPPPSSQIPEVNRSELHTPKSVAHLLSSPPPTIKSSAAAFPQSGRAVPYTDEQIDAASNVELKSMLHQLKLELKDARTSAAHYKLQYNMLHLESSEASNRMAVELDMAQREVEILQERGQLQSSLKDNGFLNQNMGDNYFGAHMVKELEEQYRSLRIENEELKSALKHTSNLAEQSESKLAAMREDNERLRERIRKNREHMNCLFDNIYDQSPKSTLGRSPSTPIRQRGLNVSKLAMSEPQSRKDQPFAALLLADKVLSQEMHNVSAMRSRTSNHQGHSRHQRGSQSLSSLPSTPSRNRTMKMAAPNSLYTPGFQPVNKVPQTAPPAHYYKRNRLRRDSTDSTISASSVEGEERFLRKDEVEESQASRAATSMLRKSRTQARGAGNIASSPPKKSTAVQAKFSGLAAKARIHHPDDARHSVNRIADADKRPPTKKSKVAGLGLGIRDLATS